MKTYILKLKTTSTVNYSIYDGTTALTDAEITTLFTTAGSAYFTFDFDSLTPASTTSLTIVDSNDTAVITNTGLVGIAEDKNFKGEWAASATSFSSFTKLTTYGLDEAQLSEIAGKIKDAGNMKPFYLTQTNNSPATLEDGFYEVLFPADVTTQTVRYIYDGAYLHPKVGFRFYLNYKLFMLKTGQTLMFFGDWDTATNLSDGAQIYSGRWSSVLVIPNYSAQKSGFLLTTPSGIPSGAQSSYNIIPLAASQGKILADRIGDLTTLTTTAKTSAVAAINELHSNAALIGTTLSTPTNVAYVATANIQDGAVTAAKADFTTYSTTEQVVGTWIDGKPLYRRVIYGGFGTVTEGTQSEITLTISGADFGLVKDYWVDRSASGAINQGYASGAIYQGYTDLSGGSCGFKFRTTSAYISNTTVYAIVEYTKSAD